MDILKKCTVCPRECKVDRTCGIGFCGAGIGIRLARAARHYWEEPCISGSRGSGAVFFSGCNLRCVYCQNKKISLGGFGKEITVQRLSEIFLELQSAGAHNINLVTPTPYVPQIMTAIDAVRSEIRIPFVYNTGGYESADTIRRLRGYIDIFLTDMKYFSPILSEKYSKAPDYFEVALPALRQMINQTGRPEYDSEGIMQKGVIIRHLVLPSYRKDSIQLLRRIAAELPTDSFVLSLMSQYTPYETSEEFPELNRRITTFEYNSVLDEAIRLNMKGYMQDRSGAKKEYTPPFDLSGV